MTVVARTESAPKHFAAAMRNLVQELDKDQPIYNVRDENIRSYLKSYFGKVEESFQGIATLEDVRPRVEDLEEWLRQVRERRKQMGKM